VIDFSNIVGWSTNSNQLKKSILYTPNSAKEQCNTGHYLLLHMVDHCQNTSGRYIKKNSEKNCRLSSIHIWKDLYCGRWGVKLYSLDHKCTWISKHTGKYSNTEWTL